MKKWIHASEELGEDRILKLLDYAANLISKHCDVRGKNEYIDDVKWGSNKFQINIFTAPDPMHTRRVNSFVWYFDPDDVFERSPKDQLDDALNEFLDYDFPAK